MYCLPWDRHRHFSATRAATVWVTLLSLFEPTITRCGRHSRASAGPIAVEIGKRSAAAGIFPSGARRRLNGDAGAVELINCENAEYSGTIGLGTPVQEFDVVVDTGSYTLWVTSVSCTQDCESNHKYDSSLSTSYVADGTVFAQSYEDGSEATGVLSEDVLSVGGLTTTVTFGEMSMRSLDGCSPVDGILGMGLSKEGDRQSAFEDLVDAGVVDVPVFSFFMGDIDTDTPMGVLTLGGVNQTHYDGCLEWIDVSTGAPDGFWSVLLQDIRIGADSAIRSGAPAILDTGTSMIVGPYEDVGYIAASIDAFCVSLSGTGSDIVEVDCESDSRDIELVLMTCDSTFQDINFLFGGDDFILTSKELLIPLTDFGPAVTSTADDPWCIFGMLGHDENMWILGDTFLRTFYTAFNVEERKVGLARATGHRVGNTCAADAPFSGDSSSDAAQPSPGPTTISSPSDESVPPVTPAPSTGNEDLVVEPTSAPVDSAPEGVSPGAGSDEGGSGGSDASRGDGEDEPSTEGEDGESQEKRDGRVNGGSSSSSSGSGDGSGGAGEGQPSLAAVAAAASLGTLVALAACVGVGFIVQRRIRRGASHGHTKLAAMGNGGGGLEMSGKSGAGGGGGGGGGGVVAGAEDDFLQARPGGYRGSGSGSHVYRAAQGGATEVNGNGAGHTNGFAGAHEVEDEEDAEVEVDFGIHPGPVAGTGLGGRLGRMFGPGRSGFSAFDDTEEAMMSERPSGQLGNI